MPRLLFWLALATSGTCLAADKDPCTVSKLNASTGAYDMLEKIAVVVPFDRQSYFLYESQDSLVKGRAVSRLCNGTEKWILYDPAYIETIKQKDGSSDLPFYFVLAHEAAHHVLDHTLRESDWDVGYWGPRQEEDADHSAAIWVNRAVRVTREDLLKAFDSLGLPEQANPIAGYPARAARRSKVIQGYEEESARKAPPSTNVSTAPPSTTAPAQPPDQFRDALLRRIEEVRSVGRPTTPLPGAISCSANRCTMFSSKDPARADTVFREVVGKVEAALGGLGWKKDDILIKPPRPLLVIFTNSGIRVRVGLYKEGDVDVEVDRL